MGRIQFLDGMRGVAVSTVVLYHYFGPTYADLLPYGSRFDLPVIRQGSGGVELFFMISGFVILMTLERCETFKEFIWRRWLRLFPAMLLATAILLAFSSFGLAGPNDNTGPLDALSGLTFIHPQLWQTVTRQPFDSLDGVFWSLYVEAGFYLIFGTLYFALGRKMAIAALAGLWISAYLIDSHLPAFAHKLIYCAGISWFGWFAAGALFYRSHESQALFWVAIPIGIVAAFLTSSLIGGETWAMRAMLFAMIALFASAQRWTRLQQALSWKPLLFVGAISYPLYLLHNRIGVSLIHAIGWSSPLAALIPLALIVPTCWLCVQYFEPTMKALLRPQKEVKSAVT